MGDNAVGELSSWYAVGSGRGLAAASGRCLVPASPPGLSWAPHADLVDAPSRGAPAVLSLLHPVFSSSGRKPRWPQLSQPASDPVSDPQILLSSPPAGGCHTTPSPQPHPPLGAAARSLPPRARISPWKTKPVLSLPVTLPWCPGSLRSQPVSSQHLLDLTRCRSALQLFSCPYGCSRIGIVASLPPGQAPSTSGQVDLLSFLPGRSFPQAPRAGSLMQVLGSVSPAGRGQASPAPWRSLSPPHLVPAQHGSPSALRHTYLFVHFLPTPFLCRAEQLLSCSGLHFQPGALQVSDERAK